MLKWSDTAMIRKIIILLSALGITASCSGCPKLQKLFVKPPPEGFIEDIIEPETGGSNYMETAVFEIPGTMSPRGMDALTAIMEVSKLMRDSMVTVKNGVESDLD